LQDLNKVSLGIIQRQSIKFTIINFIGTFIGFLSVVFIYPLDGGILYGYFQLIYGSAVLVVPLLALGMQGAIVKYYPIFVHKEKDKQFLAFTLVLTTVSIILSTTMIGLGYLFFKHQLFSIFDNFSVIDDNKYTILSLSYIITYSSVFLYHAVVRYRIVIPDIINTVGLKIFLPTLVFIASLGLIQKNWFLPILLLYFSLVAAALFVYILNLDRHEWKPDMRVLDRKGYQEFFGFMGFAVLNGLGATLALRLDITMIGAMLNVKAVAIYGIIMTISNVMEIPSKALNQIASPVISNNWANENRANIQDVYQKSSLYGLVGGLYLFLIIYFIWVDILQLMPGKFDVTLSTILTIFALLSFARIADLVTGVNSIIIAYSKDYKYHMYFLVILGLANVILNYMFIKQFGLVGAAFATTIAYLLFNTLKHFFVKYRFGFNLKFRNHFWVLLSAFLSFTTLYFIHPDLHPIVNIVLKSSITTVVFGSLIYLINPGGVWRDLLHDYLTKIKKSRMVKGFF
jgi:O-antigen/teichoic acid export membrane protein